MNLDPMGTLLPPETERIVRTILMEGTNDLVWTADVDLRNTYVSPSVERILGFTPREHLERDVSQQMTPESVVRLQRLLRAQLELERQEATGAMGPLKAELEYYRKDGSTIWLENQIGGIRDETGSMTALHAVARDVSDRRKAQQALEESERRYRVLAENASDIIWTTDTDLNITYSSPSAVEAAGIRPGRDQGPVHRQVPGAGVAGAGHAGLPGCAEERGKAAGQPEGAHGGDRAAAPGRLVRVGGGRGQCHP